MVGRRRAPRVFVVAVAALVAGCAGDGDQPREDPAPTTATSAAPSPTIDPRAQPAVDAYEAFWAAASRALQAPKAAGAKYPADADYSRYSFDPVRGEYDAYLASLAAQRVQFRGTPPRPRIAVLSVDQAAKPYPTVTLTDCQEQADWNQYVTGTDQRVPEASASVAPPYLITVTMIFFQGHWGLQSAKTATDRTCTA